MGVLAAFAMLLGYLETFIPIPIPGVKLGLANIAVLIALAERDTAGAFAIALIKVLAAGLLFGSPVTMAYSLAGTMLAFAVMAPLSRLRTMHIVMVSIIGALAHEAGQLAVAMILLGTPLVWYSAPLLALAGCTTGALCGIVAGQAIKRFDIDAEQISGANGSATDLEHTPTGPSAGIAESRKDSSTRNSHPLSFGSRGNPRIAVNPKAALVAFIIYVVVVLHLVNPIALACCLALAVAFCFAGRVGPRAVLAALVPVASILAITLIAQIANAQQGDVLVSIGPIVITLQALTAAGILIARLLCLTAASLAIMHLVATDDLVSCIAWMLRPLGRLGLPTAGFTLALGVALETVPLLASTACDLSVGAPVLSRTFWRETIPAFVARAYGNATSPS